MSDIVERLRRDAEGWSLADHTITGPFIGNLEREAADEIKRLRSSNAELLAALQCALFDLEHTYSHVSSVSADRIQSETIPLCRAAIAKATLNGNQREPT